MRASGGQAPPPNVVGYLLDEAKAVLAAAGWADVETSETRPPRRPLAGPLRVLRQRTTASGRIALVVCGERPATSPSRPKAEGGGTASGSASDVGGAAPPAGDGRDGAAREGAPA
jgi:hypothetical protein